MEQGPGDQPWDISSTEHLWSLVQQAHGILRLPGIADVEGFDSDGVVWRVPLQNGYRLTYSRTLDQVTENVLWLLHQETIAHPSQLQNRVETDILLLNTFGGAQQANEINAAVAAMRSLQSMAEIDRRVLPLARIGGICIDAATPQLLQHRGFSYANNNLDRNFVEATVTGQELCMRNSEVNEWRQQMQIFEDRLTNPGEWSQER